MQREGKVHHHLFAIGYFQSVCATAACALNAKVLLIEQPVPQSQEACVSSNPLIFLLHHLLAICCVAAVCSCLYLVSNLGPAKRIASNFFCEDLPAPTSHSNTNAQFSNVELTLWSLPVAVNIQINCVQERKFCKTRAILLITFRMSLNKLSVLLSDLYD